MKKPSRLAILGVTLMLGGAAIFLVSNAADLTAAPLLPAASQHQSGDQQDATDSQSGAQGGHQDVPGTSGQTGDHQD